jgi:hypothetical protein
MGIWEFDNILPSGVRVEVTQRDQFNNDEVVLAEALVREAIQNSSDAQTAGSAAKVRFSIHTLSSENGEYCRMQIAPLQKHLQACEFQSAEMDNEIVRVLVIEDFNTSGLTGSLEDIDKGNFDRFWRAVGESGKFGKAGGRWGLGKLVYSSASNLRLFYGLTVTSENKNPSLMGQIALKSHRIADDFYPPHGFFFGSRSTKLKLQVPIIEKTEISEFCKRFGVSRTDQTGLSIVIPFLEQSVSEAAIISGVLRNYYFPILSGRLIVEVGNLTIDKNSFLDVAKNHESALDIPFDFVANISKLLGENKELTSDTPIGNVDLLAAHFSAEQLKIMKDSFSKGSAIHVRIPVELKPKAGNKITSFIDIFLKALPEGKKPFALFARGPITLPSERRYFGSSAAYGALIATEDNVAAFLGDAENPAHTAWNRNAEKLSLNWKTPHGTLDKIRHSLRALFDLVADEVEKEDKEALIDFFSVLDKSQGAVGKQKKSPKSFNVPKPQEKGISIKARNGGFDLVAGPAAMTWSYPRVIRIRIAYDMIGANPFKRHSPFDFDLSKKAEIAIESTGSKCEPVSANTLKLIVNEPEFSLQIRGFDTRRDIVVDARVIQ